MDKLEPTWSSMDSVADYEAKSAFEPIDERYVERKVNETAIESQVAGNHYKTLGIQPIEITFANFGYAGIKHACYTKVNKYLTREKGEHRENIEKAIHCLQMQLEFYDRGDSK